MTPLTVSILLATLGAASVVVHTFEIASSSPEYVSVKEGKDMELWCKADSYWEWCKITHVPSGNSCEHAWNKDVYNVVELNCTDFEGRFEYIGDRGSTVYKCGVRVKNFRKEDYGEWKCDVSSYYDGSNKWRNYASTTSKSFQVEEEKNATTIIRFVSNVQNVGKCVLPKFAINPVLNFREITADIQTTNAKITELLRESEEKIKMRLKSIAP